MGLETKEDKISSSKFFIEATSHERFTLWQEHRNIWEEDNSGFSQIIGHVKEDLDMPVNVTFMFAKINGHRVCFYEAVSRYVDNTMVEKWIEKNYPVKYDGGSRRAMTNATNFHNVIHEFNK